jgi:hypothetical protein
MAEHTIKCRLGPVAKTHLAADRLDAGSWPESRVVGTSNMGTTLQVTFDCDDPHAMARFWASAIGYQKEDHSDLVTNLLGLAAISAKATVEVDGGRQFAEVSACRDPEGKGQRLYFQKVPGRKTTKNRVHLDLHMGADRYEVEAARLEAQGARKLWFSDDRGSPCWTMADIEGNEFCVD